MNSCLLLTMSHLRLSEAEIGCTLCSLDLETNYNFSGFRFTRRQPYSYHFLTWNKLYLLTSLRYWVCLKPSLHPIIFLRNPWTYHPWSSLEFGSPFLDYEIFLNWLLIIHIIRYICFLLPFFKGDVFVHSAAYVATVKLESVQIWSRLNYLWVQHGPLVLA